MGKKRFIKLSVLILSFGVLVSTSGCKKTNHMTASDTQTNNVSYEEKNNPSTSVTENNPSVTHISEEDASTSEDDLSVLQNKLQFQPPEPDLELSTRALQIYLDECKICCWENGDQITLPQDAGFVSITPDRNFAFYEDAGERYIYDIKRDELNVLPISYFDEVTNEYLTYSNWTDDDIYQLHHYYFKSGNDIIVTKTSLTGEYGEITSADGNAKLIQKYNRIFICKNTTADPIEVGTFVGTLYLYYINNDASLAIWFYKTDGGETILSCYSNSGKDEKLEEVTLGDGLRGISVSDFSDAFFAFSADDLYVKQIGNDIQKSAMSGGSEILHVSSTDEAYMQYPIFGTYKSLDNCYFFTGDAILQVDSEGSFHKVELSPIAYEAYLFDNYVLYTTYDDEIYYVQLNGTISGEPVNIANNVYSSRYSPCSGTIYYLTKYDSKFDSGTLYSFRLGDSEPQKIASGVYYNFEIDADGTAVFYYTDVYEKSKDLPRYAPSIGDFKAWCDGKETLVSEDVCIDFQDLPTSFLQSGLLHRNSLTFFKYAGLNENGGFYVDLCYFDGSTTNVLLSGIKP